MSILKFLLSVHCQKNQIFIWHEVCFFLYNAFDTVAKIVLISVRYECSFPVGEIFLN